MSSRRGSLDMTSSMSIDERVAASLQTQKNAEKKALEGEDHSLIHHQYTMKGNGALFLHIYYEFRVLECL